MADVKRTQKGHKVVHGTNGRTLANFSGDGSKSKARRKARQIKRRNS